MEPDLAQFAEKCDWVSRLRREYPGVMHFAGIRGGRERQSPHWRGEGGIGLEFLHSA
ncbi:MAG: hypothetical protein JJU29_17500 [Verrucomicrobia bacterium]|nr:hypothetical protein [Verrucomicrobiota bacterium]MCH8512486.1 hypothetical protein [Kiritimatiellia bacterium]